MFLSHIFKLLLATKVAMITSDYHLTVSPLWAWSGKAGIFVMTLPFGWKVSAYIYHTVGLAATSHICSLGVPCSQSVYSRSTCRPTRFTPRSTTFSQMVQFSTCWSRCLYFVCSVLVLLGYFIGLSKSVAVPQTRIRLLGFLSDSILQAFLIPQDKKNKVCHTLRLHSSESYSVYQNAPATRRQDYLFLYSCPSCLVVREGSLPWYFSGKSFFSSHWSRW